MIDGVSFQLCIEIADFLGHPQNKLLFFSLFKIDLNIIDS
jgi:hypothetical protein